MLNKIDYASPFIWRGGPTIWANGSMTVCGANESGNVHGWSSVKIWGTRWSPFVDVASYPCPCSVLRTEHMCFSFYNLRFNYTTYNVSNNESHIRFQGSRRVNGCSRPVGPKTKEPWMLTAICITDLVPGKEQGVWGDELYTYAAPRGCTEQVRKDKKICRFG